MTGIGADNNIQFKVKETTPILELKGSAINETDKKLIKGTILEGKLSTRVVKMGEHKTPFKLIKIKDEKGKFISPQVVSVFVSNFEGIEGEEVINDVEKTALGEGQKKYKKPSKLIKYGLPICGLGLGYYIAKKKLYEPKKMAGTIVFFGLLGLLPRYLMNKK